MTNGTDRVFLPRLSQDIDAAFCILKTVRTVGEKKIKTPLFISIQIIAQK